MTSGINGPCECPLGMHHAEDCPNYIDVWRTCPCPECSARRARERDELAEKFAEALRDVAFTCSRVWEAWQYGTMTQDDFSPAWENEELIGSLVDAVLGKSEPTSTFDAMFPGIQKSLDALTIAVTAPAIKHAITSTDEIVRGRPGTVARCACGWSTHWGIRDGSAEADGHEHMLSVSPEYRAWNEERHRTQEAENAHRRPAPQPPAKRTPTHSHECSCHISAPCNNCVSCKHPFDPDCDNDCQDCEENHD